jgi:hypothetical protein
MKPIRSILPIVLLASAICSSCRTVRVVEQVPVHIHDTLRLTQTLRDSIFIDHFREVTQKDDTIYITDSVSVIKYSLITDTAYRYIERPVPVVRTEQVEVEKPLSWLQKTLIYTGGFVILLAAAVIWWECRRYKKQRFANGFANRKTATD